MTDKLYVLVNDGWDPYHNLALEKYLFDHLKKDSCLLYLWGNEKTVVIGYNQNAFSECDLSAMKQDGIRLVRRLSGGGAVYHDRGNLNFTFICSSKDYDEGKQSDVIIKALETLGIEAERSGRNDLLAEGRKFSGHAYYHHGGTSYHHGTLMVDVEMDKLQKYLNVSLAKLNDKHVKSVRSRVINLRELRSDLTVEMLKQALITSFSAIYCLKPEIIAEEELDGREIEKLEKQFSDPQFVFRSEKELSHHLQQRFVWGEVRIEYELENGLFSEVEIYSDSMDPDYLASIPSILRGKTMKEAERLLADNEVGRDIISLLGKEVQR